MRRKPYTVIGLKRKACVRCSRRASSQWQICADGCVYRPVCEDCDLQLNRLVLEWAGFPDVEEKMAAYEASR